MKDTDDAKSARPETRMLIYKNAGESINKIVPLLEKNILNKKLLDNSSIKKEENRIVKSLLDVLIYLLYTHIELAIILRACLRPSLNYERRFNLKNINCSILEAYKHLYGYGKKKKKSLWIKEIKPLLELIKNTEFHNDYVSLVNQLEDFGKSGTTSLKQRNLSFHYDLNPLLVYDMLINIDEEKEVQRIISFMDLLKDIQLFISKYINRFYPLVNFVDEDLFKFSSPTSDFDIFQNKKEETDLILKKSIKNFSEKLDFFCSQQNIPDLLKQNFEEFDNEKLKNIYEYLEVQKVTIHLLYVYIDLATVSRNFIKSEYLIERKFSISQINTVVFEGYNKIYSLNDEQKNSFWKLYVCPVVLQSDDKELHNEFEAIEKELNSLNIMISSLRKERQLSVHLDQGVTEVYSMLHNINPIIEFQKVAKMLNFLNLLLPFLEKCLYSIKKRSEFIYKKQKESTDDLINNVIDLLKKTPSNLEVEKSIKLFEEIKSGKF